MHANSSSSLPPRDRLGDYLIRKGVVSESELEVALCEQKRYHRLLGDILLELGFLKVEEFYPLLAEFLNYPYVDLSKGQVAAECLKILPLERGMKLNALVFRTEGDRLHIALADPENIFIKDQLHRLLSDKWDLVFYLATLREIFAQYQGQVSLQPKTLETAVEPLLYTILSEAVQKNASDIHFVPEPKLVQLYYRVDGILQKQQILHADVWQRLAVYLKLVGKLDISETRKSQDGRFDFMIGGEPLDCRLSVVPTIHDESVVIRVLRKTKGMLQLQQLGFPKYQSERLQHLVQQPQGLFLIAGPTGSGKTTTLYALLNEIEWTSRNVVTVEDPVEYVIPGIRQSEIQPGGMQIAEVLRALLRHDPDVLYISEIRDSQTAHLAVQASLTGHLVLATLHANDVSSIPLRLKELGVDPLSLSSTLLGMMSQRLVRQLCGSCRGKGCLTCTNSGYRGRRVIAEIQLVDAALRQFLATTADRHLLQQWGQQTGHVTLLLQAQALIDAKITNEAELRRVLGDIDVASL
ncbi:GspE/PulE family protein [Candidatus Paracaedibacter symbiosus]|uniref:GspE/PulE family protein n=1 Tax=Candidatus Paracaedibacter symbiosus TaxID=244582 RepID=UPI000509901D|nr:GspE/PulE family protein [Candidatus Paracaedibacter symbiosus]